MEEANRAFKQNPEKTRGVALVREKLARIEVEVCHSLYAMELFVLERREDGDVAKLREQLWSYCFDDLVLAGLRLFTHWIIVPVAFHSVAKYWCTNSLPIDPSPPPPPRRSPPLTH